MQQEVFFVRPVQCVDPLLVLTGPQRGNHQCLRLASRKKRGAVGAGQHAGLGHDLPNRTDIASIDALSGVEDVPADDLGFEFLEHAANPLLVEHRILGALREVVGHHLGLGSIDRLMASRLVGDRVSGTQVLLDQTQDFLLECRVVDDLELARLLRGLLGELDDRLDDRLEVAVTEHHRAQHHFFVELLGLRLDHQHRVGRAGDHQVELALRHFVDLRIEHIFVVDEADARRADRTHERHTRERQRGRGRHQGEHVGIVLQVVRQRGHDHLSFVAPAVREQRAYRAVDQARNQRLFLGRTAFALEIAAGNPAGRIELFLIVDGQGKEIDARARLLGGDDGGKHLGFAIGGDDSAIGLARDLAGL